MLLQEASFGTLTPLRLQGRLLKIKQKIGLKRDNFTTVHIFSNRTHY